LRKLVACITATNGVLCKYALMPCGPAPTRILPRGNRGLLTARPSPVNQPRKGNSKPEKGSNCDSRNHLVTKPPSWGVLANDTAIR